MRSQISNAIEDLGWVKSEQQLIPEEVKTTMPFNEGAVREICVDAYERSSVALEQCILHHGCKCAVCDIVLSNIYGDIAHGYIHVHHLRQLSEIKESYQVDPINDLLPLCPNCHAIIHIWESHHTRYRRLRNFYKDLKNANHRINSHKAFCLAGYADRFELLL